MFLNLLLLIFPFLCFFLYLFYEKIIIEKENELFFDLTLFLSCYITIKFGNNNIYEIMLINIPIFIAMFKKRYFILFFNLIIFYINFDNLFDINICFYIFNYLIIFLILNIKKGLFVPIYQILLITYVFMFLDLIPFKLYLEIVFSSLLSYLISFFLIYFINKIRELSNVYRSLNECMKDKKLYESLFKITHEIKNPLAVCKGYLEMFDLNDSVKSKKYVSIINQEIDRTLNLLQDFSDISKSINIKKELVDINLLLEDVCDEIELFLKKNIIFNYVIEEDEVLIEGDYNRLKQVLINILKNSKESIEKEGFINLKTSKYKNNYVIEIKDSGCGMDDETLKKIGTAFYTTKKQGTGLGVCFSKEIIEKHGGNIEYISKKEKGTTTFIKLPLKKLL